MITNSIKQKEELLGRELSETEKAQLVSKLKVLLTRPGFMTAMDDAEAEVIMMITTELFDKNGDGKLSISEVATALEEQFGGF